MLDQTRMPIRWNKMIAPHCSIPPVFLSCKEVILGAWQKTFVPVQAEGVFNHVSVYLPFDWVSTHASSGIFNALAELFKLGSMFPHYYKLFVIIVTKFEPLWLALALTYENCLLSRWCCPYTLIHWKAVWKALHNPSPHSTKKIRACE